MRAPVMRLRLPRSEATDTLGQALAATRPARAVVHLHGDLGSGKSTLARALLRALGVGGAIRSPTYTLVERYGLVAAGQPAGEALHVDLYRIAEAGELEFLGLDDGDADLWLVEWPERGGAQGLPAPDLRLRLQVEGAGRGAELQAATANGQEWLQRLSRFGSLQPFSEH